MALVRRNQNLEQETFTHESGLRSRESLVAEQAVVEQHLLVLSDLHTSRLDAETFDASAMTSYERSISELGEDPSSDNLDAVALMTSGALMNPDTAEALFRKAEQDKDGILRSAWTKSLDIRTHATSAEEEAHALDLVLEAAVNDKRGNKATKRRVSALASGLLSQYPNLVAKYAGHLVDQSDH